MIIEDELVISEQKVRAPPAEEELPEGALMNLYDFREISIRGQAEGASWLCFGSEAMLIAGGGGRHKEGP